MRIEHANVTVPSIEKAVHFLKTVFPEFEVRNEGMGGEGQDRRRWLHVGTDSTYVALEELQAKPESPTRKPYFDLGYNHLCFEVENIDGIHDRLAAAGYPPRFAPKEKFRKRLYVHDHVGNEWEFVEYFSQVPSEKNLYE